MALAIYIACSLAMIGVCLATAIYHYRAAAEWAPTCKRAIHYYRGSLECCPECGGEVAAKRPDACNFALICPETGNEVFIRVDQASAVES